MPKGYLFEKQYGVEIFDDTHQPKNGWACISEQALIFHSNDKKSSVLSKLFSTVITFLSGGENVGSQI
jgi:hypothetical protein